MGINENICPINKVLFIDSWKVTADFILFLSNERLLPARKVAITCNPCYISEEFLAYNKIDTRLITPCY